MPQNYFHNRDARRAEDSIPSLSYTALVESLPRLTDLGVIAHGNPAAMLVVARLVDRTRIERSGITRAELRQALAAYLAHPKAFFPVVKALEQAVERALENEGQAAAYGAR